MKMLSLLTKVEIGISIIPFLIIVLFTGYYKLFFTYFIITLIHELGHIVVAAIFKVETQQIKLNIFGFSATLEDYKYLKLYKQILILLAGPITYFISKFLIDKFYAYEIISLMTYYKAILTNKYILIFNLLPIFPLDGGRIFKVILDRLFTFKISKYISLFVSFIFIILFVIYTSEHKQYLMYMFLTLNLFLNLLFIEKEWKIFLASRYYFDNKYVKKLHKRKDIYVYKNNYIIENKCIYDEKKIIKKMLKEG